MGKLGHIIDTYSILRKDEVASKTSNVAINHLVLKDLNRKRNQIKTMANKTNKTNALQSTK